MSAAVQNLREADFLAGAEAQLQALADHFEAEGRRVAQRAGLGGKRAAVVMSELAEEIRRQPLVSPEALG